MDKKVPEGLEAFGHLYRNQEPLNEIITLLTWHTWDKVDWLISQMQQYVPMSPVLQSLHAQKVIKELDAMTPEDIARTIEEIDAEIQEEFKDWVPKEYMDKATAFLEAQQAIQNAQSSSK